MSIYTSKMVNVGQTQNRQQCASIIIKEQCLPVRLCDSLECFINFRTIIERCGTVETAT